jgi:hypothetical protein
MSGRQDWLRILLKETGRQQQDVAKLWKCDGAVVSRFIASGAPELTWDRAVSLSKMFQVSLDELHRRISGAERSDAIRPPSVGSLPAAQHNAIANLESAVEHLRAALPDATVKLSIVMGDRTRKVPPEHEKAAGLAGHAGQKS